MPPTVRSEQSAGSNTVNPTFTLAAGTVAGDLVVLIEANSWYLASDLTTPTGTGAGSWTLQHTFDGGSNACHVKVYTASAVGGAGTVVPGYSKPPPDEEKYAQVVVVADGVFGSAGSTSTASSATAIPAPSLTPVAGETADLLICSWGFPDGGNINYTVPGSMTGLTERDVSSINTYRSAYEVLSSDAATGTRTATGSAARLKNYGVSVLIAPATAAIEHQGVAALAGVGALSGAAALYESTGALYAGVATEIAGTWANESNAVGSGTGTYATWTDSTLGTTSTLELATFGGQAAVPAGSSLGPVRITVRHSESPAAAVTSVTAQAYLGATPYGSPIPLTVSATVHNDTIAIDGLTRADLADLRIQLVAVRV